MMRNPNAPHIDYEFLRGVIPSSGIIAPSNVDGLLERRGNFLILEWKKEGEKFGGGQRIALEQLAKLRNFTVLIITGYTETTEDGVLCVMEKIEQLKSNGSLTEIKEDGVAPIDLFKRKYKAWYESR